MRYNFAYLLVLFFTVILAQRRAQVNELDEDDECIKGLYNYTNHFLGNESIVNLFMYTGKEANDLGDHKNCVKKRGNYLIANFKQPNQSTVSLGLCVPLSCNETHMGNFNKTLVDVINGMLKKYTFEESDVNVYNPEIANKDLYETKLAYITFGIVVVLAVLILIGAIKSNEKLSSCFSLFENASLLFNDKVRVEDVMNGIRVLAMFWIIIGQSLIITLKAPVYNIEEVQDIIRKERRYVLFITAPWAVDVFLCISGFFSAISSYKTLKKDDIGAIGILLLCPYRYLRLISIYMIGMLTSYFIVPILNNGPIYSRIEELKRNCDPSNNWDFIILNNFVNIFNLCLNWTWYLGLDFQFFLLAPFLTLLFIKVPKKGYILVISLIGVSIMLQVILAIAYNLNIYHIIDDHKVRDDLYEVIVTKPYCRIDVYLLGMITGWLYLTNAFSALKDSACKRWFLYLMGTTLMVVMFFTYFEFYNSSPKLIAFSSIYMALSKFLFVMGLLMIVYPALLGKCRGSIFLSIEFWTPLAKSTYSAYIFHFIIFMFYIMTLEEGVFFSFHKLVRNATDVLVLTYLLALLLTLLVDLPLRRLWKRVLELEKLQALTEEENLIAEDNN